MRLRATPEQEDFAGKYVEDGNGGLGAKLLAGYFKTVENLFDASDVGNHKSARVIELGCGEGFSTQKLQQFMPKNVKLEASEYVEHQIPLAKKRNPGLKITQESIYELTHKDNTFDLVFLPEVLEHLDYPDKALAEIRRVVKPGGYLIIGVPHEPLWCILNMLRGKYLKNFGNTPGHLNHWMTTGLKRFVVKRFGTVEATKTPLPWTILLAKKAE